MYGLRDAPLIWQKVVKAMLEEKGFKALIGTQCVYTHKKKRLTIVAHVDDFLCQGTGNDLRELLQSLKKDFECSGEILGPNKDEVNQLKFLGRTIALTPDGIEWEGDEKHVQAFLKKMERHTAAAAGRLAGGGNQKKGAATPGIKREGELYEERSPLNEEGVTDYRGLVALLNYLSQDRPDTAFASKEAAKTMASPAQEDIAQLKRVARYLVAHPRCALEYKWQNPVKGFDTFTDSDWGGDVRTRKSTSGGCVMRGKHLLMHWSRTQQTVALSSAEAELNALCKGAQEGLGAKTMTEEIGVPEELSMRTDASAAVGILNRQGTGRIKHLQISQLWLQEKIKDQVLKLFRIPRNINIADLLTHHWSEREGGIHLSAMHVVRRRLRECGAPEGGSKRSMHYIG